MENLRPDQHLCLSLYQAARVVTQTHAPLLGKLGLTYPQYLALLVLHEEGEATLTRIGERLRLDSGTLTPMLRRMEQRGLLTRARSETDQRQVLLRLTAAGRRAHERSCAIPAALFAQSGLAAAQVKE